MKVASTLQDFYTGEKLITRLTHKNWEQRVTHGFWFVKFYAPVCPRLPYMLLVL